MNGKWGLAGRSLRQHLFVGLSSLCGRYRSSQRLNWGEEFGKCKTCLNLIEGRPSNQRREEDRKESISAYQG